MIHLNINDIKQMVAECADRILSEAHLAVVDNLQSAELIIQKQWTSPDDFWYVTILQRKKDYRNYNKRHGNVNQKWFTPVGGPDSNKKENFVGWAIIQGNTVDEAIDSLRHPTVNLNPWAQQRLGGQATYPSGPTNNAIVDITKIFWARSYMSINKRSMAATKKVADNDVKKMGKSSGFAARAFNHRAGQAKSGNDGTMDWDKERPWTMVDCDLDDDVLQDKLEKYLEKKGFKAELGRLSHDGKQFFYSTPDITGVNLKYFNSLPGHNAPGDPNVSIHRDAKIILYSPCGE